MASTTAANFSGYPTCSWRFRTCSSPCKCHPFSSFSHHNHEWRPPLVIRQMLHCPSCVLHCDWRRPHFISTLLGVLRVHGLPIITVKFVAAVARTYLAFGLQHYGIWIVTPLRTFSPVGPTIRVTPPPIRSFKFFLDMEKCFNCSGVH